MLDSSFVLPIYLHFLVRVIQGLLMVASWYLGRYFGGHLVTESFGTVPTRQRHDEPGAYLLCSVLWPWDAAGFYS